VVVQWKSFKTRGLPALAFEAIRHGERDRTVSKNAGVKLDQEGFDRRSRKVRTMRTRCSLFAMAIFALLVCVRAEAGDTKTCYSNVYDQDDDGYAAKDAPESDVSIGSRDLHCPSGYRAKAGDCDDANQFVHPRTYEIALNQRDDNCNGLLDEPTFFYDADGNRNRTNSIAISFAINHAAIFNEARSRTLKIGVRLMPLVTADSFTEIYIAPWDVSYSVDFTTGQITIDNLSPGTVWAVRLYFYHEEFGGEPVRIGPQGDRIGDGIARLVDTEWYYTMTDSPVPAIHNRFRAVMRGLAEFHASQVGEVGYRGTVNIDGRRYAADRNERWCSEFYVWVTKPFVRGIGGSTVEKLMDFFGDRGELRTAREVPAASPGDYLAMDSDEDGDLNHSGMFLAFDRAQGIVWTLEGNSGNEVQVNQRSFRMPIALGEGTVLRRLGRIGDSMWQ
jgi:hypothetical protein